MENLDEKLREYRIFNDFKIWTREQKQWEKTLGKAYACPVPVFDESDDRFRNPEIFVLWSSKSVELMVKQKGDDFSPDDEIDFVSYTFEHEQAMQLGKMLIKRAKEAMKLQDKFTAQDIREMERKNGKG